MKNSDIGGYEKLYKMTCDKYHHLKVSPLFPEQFFLAWHGVITLMFQQFPPQLVELKEWLQEQVPNLALELAGSKWPKVTLAARATNHPLTKSEVAIVDQLLKEFSVRLTREPPLFLNSISVVQYECQSLEKLNQRFVIPLRPYFSETYFQKDLQTEVKELIEQRQSGLSAKELERICSSSRDISDYRKLHLGWTLIAELPNIFQDTLLDLQAQLAKKLPQRYIWFEPSSRHLTLRDLSLKNK